jgi:hypothetical protein
MALAEPLHLPPGRLAQKDHVYTHWDCREHADGLYYLNLTN